MIVAKIDGSERSQIQISYIIPKDYLLDRRLFYSTVCQEVKATVLTP